MYVCCVFFFTKFANDLWLVQRSLTKDYLRACSIFSSDGSILNSSREKERNAEKRALENNYSVMSHAIAFSIRKETERGEGETRIYFSRQNKNEYENSELVFPHFSIRNENQKKQLCV